MTQEEGGRSVQQCITVRLKSNLVLPPFSNLNDEALGMA